MREMLRHIWKESTTKNIVLEGKYFCKLCRETAANYTEYFYVIIVLFIITDILATVQIT